jgi:ribosome-associated translation inhibitor RaiA
MRHTRKRDNLNVQFAPHQCHLSEAEIDKMLVGLDALGRQVAHFPTADLHVLVARNERSNDFSVKLTLILDGATLVGNDHDQVAHAAYERCLRGLSANVRAYKERLGQVPERQKTEKGTHQQLLASSDPDPAALEAAVRSGDYVAFRTATVGYEGALRDRIGRWVQRYPAVDAQIGRRLTIADLVEKVFLLAFERYNRRPGGLRFGDWLEALIDPSVKQLHRRPEEELENVRLAQSAVEAERGPGTV